MTYEDFQKEKDRISKLETPYLLEQQGITWKMKCVFIDYGYDKISKSGALTPLEVLLRDWKDAQEAINELKEELNSLTEEVKF